MGEATLAIVWDFDSAQGQVGATYPYHYRRLPLEQELEGVAILREQGARLGVPMTFATVGFVAEDVPAPFEAHDLIRGLHADGHEIASHSWRHEWLPHLTTQQLRRSLVRSKVALERVTGEVGCVRGLVPPFNRPMTWLRHGIVRAGDRWAFPPGRGATNDGLLREASGAGYDWVRISMRPLLGRTPDPLRAPFREGGCTVVPHHYDGFDGKAGQFLDQAVDRRRLFVLTGHPSGLFRPGNEHVELVTGVLEDAARRRDSGTLRITTVTDSIAARRVSGLEIVEYDDRWEVAHTEFARRNWPTKRRRQDSSFNRWKFRGPTQGPVRGLILAVNGDEVIGQLGLLPGLMAVDRDQYPIQWACDLMVDPEKRLKRTGSSLFEAAFDRPDITLGSDPSPAATATMSKLGFTMRPSSSVMILTLQAGPVVSIRYPQLKRLAPIVNAVGAPAVRYLNRTLIVGGRSPAAQACGWRDVVDLVAARDASAVAPHEVHDRAFLQWRCGGIDGWTRDLDAIRTERGSFLIYEREPHRVTIHQWAAADPAEAAALFGRLLFIAGGYGVANVQAYAYGADEVELLTGLGFRARRTSVEIWSYPSELLDAHALPFTFAGYDSDYLL